MENFPCTKCGCCCNRIDRAAIAGRNIGIDFPFSWDENGRCEKLDSNNKCEVYENRPLLCNIDKLIKEFNLNKSDFYKENINMCNNFMELDNIPLSYRIKV